MSKSLYIIDGFAHIFRSYYAPFRPLNSPSGEPTKATHVFCQMVLNLIRKRSPDYLAIAFDVSDQTVFRRDLFPAYKANRDATPEDLVLQIARIRQIVNELNIPTLSQQGFEADDLMATAVEVLKDEDVRIYLVSGDKDLEQLLSDRVCLYDPAKDVELDPHALQDKRGYSPQQAVEVQTLAGDSTDNIPGVKGVGMKTAAKLINKYGSADAVLAHVEDLTPKMRENVEAFADQLPTTRQLVTLRRDVPLTVDLSAYDLARITPANALATFDELGFNRQRDAWAELAGEDAAKSKQPASTASSKSDSAAAHAEAPANQAASASNDVQLKYQLINTPAALRKFAKKLAKTKCFAFDTETTALNPVAAALVGISICWEPGEGYYLPVRGTMKDVLPLDSVVAEMGPLFADASIAKIGHNLKYDVLALRQAGIETKGLAFDTLLASFLLDPLARSHSLDGLARAIFGHDMIPISELIGKGKNQVRMDEVDVAQAAEYAAEDADFTWRLYTHFEPQVSGSHVEVLFRDTEMPLIEVLAEMEQNGISLDCDLLSKLGDELRDKMEDLKKTVYREAGREFNIDSPKQLAVVLFDEQNLPVIRKTKTSRSTDADTLEALTQQTDNPIPKLVQDYRELSKLLGTYIDTLPKMICRKTNRIHANFNQIGAITGRLSSNDPNLQNIPIRSETGRRIRRAFVAVDGDHALLRADYSQVELRLLAHFCQDDNLVAAFRDGLDIHAAVAAKVNGITLDEVTGEQRSAAKAVNFGIIYGQTPFGLSRGLGISVDEAKSFITSYFLQYPGIQAFIDKCISDARARGYAQTILGRRRPIEELHSRNRQRVSFGERIAVNTVVQGSAADLIKRAMLSLHADIQGGRCPAKMLIQVHDELVFEVAKRDEEAAAQVIRDRMEHALDLDVPLEVDMAIGPNWAEAK